MQFMSDLGYRQDSGYLMQSAAKFWFENSLGDLTVFPQSCGLKDVSEVIAASRCFSQFKKYNFDLAFLVPVTSRSGSKEKGRRNHGSMLARAVFRGGGPAMLRDSEKLTIQALRKLGYLDGNLNSDVTEAVLAFVNRPANKHTLRKLEMLPVAMDKLSDVDEKLRAAFLSHAAKGHWQVPAQDLEVRQLLQRLGFLSSSANRPKTVSKAMREYAQQEGLPWRRTYNLNVFQIMHHANTNPNKAGWVEFQS